MKKKIMMCVFSAMLILSPALSVRGKITNDSVHGMSMQRADVIVKKYIYKFVFLCIVCSIFGWWFMPAYFLRDVDPMEVKEIRVYNGNSENDFVIMEPGDIAIIVNSIKEISFNKYEICSGAGYWYYLGTVIGYLHTVP